MSKEEKNPRLNKVGGQAVLDGVMMKAGTDCATACRCPDGSIAVIPRKFVSVRKKHRILNLPLLRGAINLVEMLILSMSILSASADLSLSEEELEESRLEIWMKKHFGIRLFDILMVVAGVLGVALAIGLFMFLPKAGATGLEMLLSHFNVIKNFGIWSAVIEGALKILIFISYLALVSLMPDIRRTFQYHGAEHKSIACFESGEELTPANAKRHTRYHPRCGTSFMFVMILIGIFVGLLVNYLFPGLSPIAYTGIRLLILPLVVGIGYEFIMFAGKHDNPITRVLSAPGLWVQRITTREPSEEQLEVAICALKYALVSEFPDFDREAITYRPRNDKAEDGESASSADADTSDPDASAAEATDHAHDAS